MVDLQAARAALDTLMTVPPQYDVAGTEVCHAASEPVPAGFDAVLRGAGD
ncbi:hypothetical protein [Streptomyces sp. SudanB182_2057]